jgi:hypothetical protein
MAEDEEDARRVDRRAFLRGAGRRTAARATTGGLRRGLFGWAIARAEASARPVEEDEELERDWYVEALDEDGLAEELEAQASTAAAEESGAYEQVGEDGEWFGVDLNDGPPPPPDA